MRVSCCTKSLNVYAKESHPKLDAQQCTGGFCLLRYFLAISLARNLHFCRSLMRNRFEHEIDKFLCANFVGWNCNIGILVLEKIMLLRR